MSPRKSDPTSTLGSARRYVEDTHRFVRDYAGGVRPDDVRRLFQRDATAAWERLARDEGRPEKSSGELARLFHTARIFFLGVSFKLSPARRLLFAASLLFALLGLIEWAPHVVGSRLVFDASPTWFALSIAGLVFLLILTLVDQVRVRDELEVAQQLQRDLLPQSAPEVPGWSLAHSYETANEVGGDYYDFIPLSDGRLAIVVGDASGHGIAAGLLMAIANASLHMAMAIDPEPVAVLRLLNRSLYRTGDRRAFMTLFYGVLDPRSGRLVFASSAHPFPLVRRRDRPDDGSAASEASIVELGTGGLPLGLRPEIEVDASEVTLDPGDQLVVYTDGLPEALDAGERAFGYERVRSLLAQGGTPEEIHRRIDSSLHAHLGERQLDDDWSLVVLGRRLPVPPPPGAKESLPASSS